jgi:Glycosyltransferase WbsX
MAAMARPIAYYLPQFYPTPYNDSWWGAGFTEWRSVAQARTMYRGHYQPHVPADLGFYDLRVPEVRAAQAELAQAYGITGFCYWHYWLGGTRLLERPFQEVLTSGEPRFPFCLAWANHSWSGVWFGGRQRHLIEQTYPGQNDHEEHFRFLLRAFVDPRYITVGGKPLLVIYRPGDIPDVRRVLDGWQELALRAGLPGLQLVAHDMSVEAARALGFQASTHSNQWRVKHTYPQNRLARRLLRLVREALKRPGVYPYRRVHQYMLGEGPPHASEYPCVIPNWDTTPRLQARGIVLHGSTPEAWRTHLRAGLARVVGSSAEQRILFVKSWNEWAEGNHLEPDLRYGRGHLEVLRQELESLRAAS